MPWEIDQKNDAVAFASEGMVGLPIPVEGRHFIRLEKIEGRGRMRVHFWGLDPALRKYVAKFREFHLEDGTNRALAEKLSAWEMQPAPDSN